MHWTGFEIVGCRQLAGVLSSCFRQNASDVGGPITLALREAAVVSTAERVARLEGAIAADRRRASRLLGAPAELRRQEEERKTLEVRALKRSKAQRLPHPLAAFLRQAQESLVASGSGGESSSGPDMFQGLGMDSKIPIVLRFDGKIKNR